MRARVMAIVSSLFLAAFVLLMMAGTASASPTGTHDALQRGAAMQVPTAGDESSSPSSSGSSSSSSSSDASSGSAATPNVAFHGTITAPVGKGGAKVPLEGIKITVTQDGKTIGSASSDKDGEWRIAVPKPGIYTVTLDVSSLPKTVQIKKQGGETLKDLRVQGGFLSGTATFQLVAEGEGTGSGGGGGGGGSTTQLEYYVSVAVVGLQYGLIIAMTAVGLSLIFGTTGLINFAHGELVTIGAVVAYLFGTAPLQWPFIIAIIIALLAVGVLGGIIELALWRPLRKRGTGLIQMFIISIGLSLLLRYIIQFFFGANRHFYAQATVEQPLHFGPVNVTPRDLTIIIISVVVLVAIALMLQRTRMGKAMRALSDNRDLAEASGIDVKRVILQVWILGGGLAALGGVFFGLATSVYWNMGYFLLLLMFAGVILGGLGSAYGAMLGSIVVGLVAQFSTVWFPGDLQNAWALLVLIVVLLVRPQGILGRLQRAG